LLSLACPGHGLGSAYVPPLCLCHCHFDSCLDTTSVTGLELVGVMPVVQGFVRCDAGSLRLVIIPKSEDRFME
jgi:hypothetical protein